MYQHLCNILVCTPKNCTDQHYVYQQVGGYVLRENIDYEEFV